MTEVPAKDARYAPMSDGPAYGKDRWRRPSEPRWLRAQIGRRRLSGFAPGHFGMVNR